MRRSKIARTTLLGSIVAATLVITAGPAAPADLQRRPGGWSAPVNGLRARLVQPRADDVPAGATPRLVIELRNDGGAPVAFRTPVMLDATLRKRAGGVEIAPDRTYRFRPRRQWGVVPTRSYLGLPVEHALGPPPPAGLRAIAIGGKVWHVEPGVYVLESAFAQSTTTGPDNTWHGRIDVPSTEIMVE